MSVAGGEWERQGPGVGPASGGSSVPEEGKQGPGDSGHQGVPGAMDQQGEGNPGEESPDLGDRDTQVLPGQGGTGYGDRDPRGEMNPVQGDTSQGEWGDPSQGNGGTKRVQLSVEGAIPSGQGSTLRPQCSGRVKNAILKAPSESSTPRYPTRGKGGTPHPPAQGEFTTPRPPTRGKVSTPGPPVGGQDSTPRSPTQGDCGTPKPPSQDEGSTPRYPSSIPRPPTRGKASTPRYPARGECSTPRYPVRNKDGTQQLTAQGESSIPRSVRCGTRRPSAQVELNMSKPTTQGKGDTLRTPAKSECSLQNTLVQGRSGTLKASARCKRGTPRRDASEAACLGKSDRSVARGSSEAPRPGKADASEAPCIGEMGATGTACLHDIGTSGDPFLDEKGASVAPGKEGTLAAMGEGAATVSPFLGEEGALMDQGEGGASLAPCKGENVALAQSHVPEVPVDGGHSASAGQTSSESSGANNLPSVQIFNIAVETFLDKLVEAGSYKVFAKCYERFYKFQPEMTRSIYDQFISQLQTSFKDEIKEIKEEGNMEALLDSLDKVKEEAKNRVAPAWRPSGVPEEDVRSTLVPYYLQQREYMRRLLREKEKENAKLAESVLAGRERIVAMQQQIQKRKEAWQAISKAGKELIMAIPETKSGRPGFED